MSNLDLKQQQNYDEQFNRNIRYPYHNKASYQDDMGNQDHLEDYDSEMGDVEAGSLGATLSSGSTRQQNPTVTSGAPEEYDDPVRRGMMNAQADYEKSSKTPGRFMEQMMVGGQSVNSGNLEAMFDEAADPYDTYTFDGSTITSANDITHKRFQKQQILDFPGNNHPELKLAPSQATETTSFSGSRLTEESRVKKICCGLGRLGIVLISLALLMVSLAFILWLTLSYLPSQQSSSSSPCCKGEFEPNWSGREICNSQTGGRPDICCVVCASSVVAPATGSGNNQLPQELEDEPEPTPTPSAFATTGGPLVATPVTDAPTPAPSAPATTGGPFVATTTTTDAPTSAPCCEGEPRWADFIGRVRCSNTDPQDCCQVCTIPTSAPSERATTAVPSAAPTTAATQTTPEQQGGVADSVIPDAATVTPTSPCCTDDWRWGDYFGRVRCDNENDCCEVCNTP